MAKPRKSKELDMDIIEIARGLKRRFSQSAKGGICFGIIALFDIPPW